MSKYRDVVFLLGEDFSEFETAMQDYPWVTSTEWQDAAQEYLSQWDQGDNGTVTDREPFGTSDYVLSVKEHYIITYNSGMSYVGYTEVIEDE